jgi:flagellar biosynthesis protein FliQ
MGTVYRHTQVGRVTVVLLAIAWATALWWSLRMSQPVLVAVTVLVGCLLAIFSTLTVVVRDQTLDVFFGPGLIRRRIPLHRIRAVRTVRTPWYYGWGIRLTPSGWLWNVSGLGGVEIQFDDGHCFRIGSDEPEKLAEVLRREI